MVSLFLIKQSSQHSLHFEFILYHRRGFLIGHIFYYFHILQILFPFVDV